MLNITEVLGKILFALAARRILSAQLVSKTFHATIDSSPRLQQALWFAPKQGKADSTRLIKLNPILKERMQGSIPIATHVMYGEHRRINVLIDGQAGARACRGASFGKMLL